ncbi:MAG TPA: hypothetical protein VIP78_03975 [Candidatus Dormibacteraeota bacterium]|jgi:hypothetical protein
MSPVFATQIVARVIVVVQVILGILVWTGHGDSLIPLHIAVGLLLVVDLWAAVALGLRAAAPIGLVVLALVWSVGMPVFGLVQTNLLPGGAHVAVQLLHLVVGLGAVGLVENLARRSRRLEEVTE